MKSYQVINKATGALVYRYRTDGSPIEWGGMEFATHDHVEIVEAVPDAPVVAVYGGRRILTKLEFLRLFTQPERIAIKQASGASPQLDDYLYLLEFADDVNLDSADTQTGVNTLELAGILAAGRAAEVLNG